MNRTQFFSTVKLARVPVAVIQEGDKGFKLIASVQHDDEEPIEIGLLYQNEPRYFKSLSSVGDVMREYGVKEFSVKMDTVKVAVKRAAKKKTDQVASTAKAANK